MKMPKIYSEYEISACNVDYALVKLKRESVTIYDLRKIAPTKIRFSIDYKDDKKFFAIFNRSCYNIKKLSTKGVFYPFYFLFKNIGVCVGILIFCFLIIFSNYYVFKINVQGSGGYYKNEINNILKENGITVSSLVFSKNFSEIEGKILALPYVSFCNISKDGSILTVEVHVSKESEGTVKNDVNLISKTDGVIYDLICLRGHPLKKEGDAVLEGEIIIEAYSVILNGESEVKIPTAVIAKATIKSQKVYEYQSPNDNEQVKALSVVMSENEIDEEDILNKTITVEEVDGGYLYKIDLEYLTYYSLNI